MTESYRRKTPPPELEREAEMLAKAFNDFVRLINACETHEVRGVGECTHR